ncbi:hypothetical protein ABQF34_05465 [Mycolicibacterium boenickei]
MIGQPKQQVNEGISSMNSRVSSGLTACAAIATAGVIAVTPMATSTPTPPRVVDAQVALTADFTGKDQIALTIIAGERLVDQFVQAPLTPFVLAAQLAGGDNERLFSQIRQIVDSPLYVADPLIEAIAITLPEEFGGGSDHVTNTTAGDGDFMKFRNEELLGLRDDINAQFASALDVDTPWPNENYTSYLSNKLMESALRMASLPILQVSSLITLAQAVESGENVEIYKVVRDYIDGPQWAIDPAIEGIAHALPESLGGGTNHDPRTSQGNPAEGIADDGALMQFRNKEMLGVRNAVRVAAANVLGVDVNDDGNLPSGARSLAATNDESDGNGSEVNKLKPHVTSLNASLDDAKDRAEKRRDKAKSNVDKVVKRVQTAADNTAKKLGLKKAEKSDSED